MTRLRNLTLFIILALWHGIPPWLWREAWEGVEADQMARARKAVWKLKCEGRIYEDEEGGLWPRDEP